MIDNGTCLAGEMRKSSSACECVCVHVCAWNPVSQTSDEDGVEYKIKNLYLN